MVWFVGSVRPKRSRRLVAKGEDGQPIRVLVSEPRARGRISSQGGRVALLRRGDEPARSDTSLQQSRRRQLTAQGTDQRLVSDAVIRNTHF